MESAEHVTVATSLETEPSPAVERWEPYHNQFRPHDLHPWPAPHSIRLQQLKEKKQQSAPRPESNDAHPAH